MCMRQELLSGRVWLRQEVSHADDVYCTRVCSVFVLRKSVLRLC